MRGTATISSAYAIEKVATQVEWTSGSPADDKCTVCEYTQAIVQWTIKSMFGWIYKH